MISSSSLAKKKNNMASLVQTARSPSPDARSMNRNVKVRERTSEGNSEFRVFLSVRFDVQERNKRKRHSAFDTAFRVL